MRFLILKRNTCAQLSDLLGHDFGGCQKSQRLPGSIIELLIDLGQARCEYSDRSFPLGKCCRSRPLAFSFVGRCQGLCRSAGRVGTSKNRRPERRII